MNSSVKNWLESNFCDAGPSSPERKKIKFTELSEAASSTFASSASSKAVSKVIAATLDSVFPNCTTKREGKKRETYVYGLQRITTESRSMQEVVRENDALTKQVAELREELARLKRQESVMDEQVQSLISPSMEIYHGPSTLDHLANFSLDSVMEEAKENAPDVMKLLSEFARCGRFDKEDGSTSEQSRIADIRTTMALCTLLKGRSAKVLGIQLLIAFTLIAEGNQQTGWKKGEGGREGGKEGGKEGKK